MIIFAILLNCALVVIVLASSEGAESALSSFKTSVIDAIGQNPLAAVKALKSSGIGRQILYIENSPRRKALFPNSSGDTNATPIVQMHGLGDFANNPHGMVAIAQRISEYLGESYVLNVQIGKSSVDDISNSFFMNLNDQVDYFAAVVGSDPALKEGFNAIGYSQGSLVIRGYIEKYNNPPVLNFISVHGALAGISDYASCDEDDSRSSLCSQLSTLLKHHAYTSEVQNGFAPSNYYRDPRLIAEYNEYSLFLKSINNEIPGTEEESGVHKSRWAGLNSLCLVRAANDREITPSASQWFGFYEDGSRNYVLDMRETLWYEGDYFGLQQLDEQHKISLHTTKGSHLEFNVNFVLDLVKSNFVL